MTHEFSARDGNTLQNELGYRVMNALTRENSRHTEHGHDTFRGTRIAAVVMRARSAVFERLKARASEDFRKNPTVSPLTGKPIDREKRFGVLAQILPTRDEHLNAAIWAPGPPYGEKSRALLAHLKRAHKFKPYARGEFTLKYLRDRHREKHSPSPPRKRS